MTAWIYVPALLFIVVILFTRIANRQARGRKTRSFKTNYYAKRRQGKTEKPDNPKTTLK